MYEQFYGLQERPFDLTPNPKYLLLTASHREALGNIEYGISAHKGVTLVIGEAGTGKTTLIRTAIARAEIDTDGPKMRWAYLKNPTISPPEFLAFLASRFALSGKAALSKIDLLDEIEGALTDGLRAVLIVDEAQSVPHALLEEIRLLANIESDTKKLLPVVLAGQPELAERLNEPALRQLKQRIALRCNVSALSLHETASYISGRISIAGGQPAKIFSREAVVAIHNRSGGIPRIINVLCDNALMTGYVADERPVNEKVIETVGRDFDFTAARAFASSREGGQTVHNRPVNNIDRLQVAASEVVGRTLRGWWRRSS